MELQRFPIDPQVLEDNERQLKLKKAQHAASQLSAAEDVLKLQQQQQQQQVDLQAATAAGGLCGPLGCENFNPFEFIVFYYTTRICGHPTYSKCSTTLQQYFVTNGVCRMSEYCLLCVCRMSESM